MPRCKNCPKNTTKPTYYTGKEKTPRGKGFAAKHEQEGKKMKGKDGNMYHVSKNRWVLHKSKVARKMTPTSGRKRSPGRPRKTSPQGAYMGASVLGVGAGMGVGRSTSSKKKKSKKKSKK